MEQLNLKTDKIIAYTDGASRGNPGPASYGVSILDAAGEEVDSLYEALGTQTNNYAEYMGVLKALEYAAQNGIIEVEIRSDSQLLVRQLIGQYKVKSPILKPLYLDCVAVMKKIEKVKFTHVPREQNKRADALANQALDEIV